VLVLLLGLASVGFAQLNDYNELANPGFEEGGADWDSEGVLFNAGADPQLGRPDIAWAEGEGSRIGYLRQIVDDSLSPYWNPNWNQKDWMLTGWVYTWGENGYIRLGIDWWSDPNRPRPLPGEEPDGRLWSDPVYSVNQWGAFEWHGSLLGCQPRWVSVEIEFYGSCLGEGAAVDDLHFSAECVPEPSTLMVLATGLGGMCMALRRRRA